MKHNFTVSSIAVFAEPLPNLGSPRRQSAKPSAHSRRVGAALFIRTTRSVGLTEAGQRFLSRAKPAFEELVAASAVARQLGQRPAGLLRLTVPRAVVPILLQPVIASFCRAYPGIEVEIAASGELVDIAAQEFDAGIRLGRFVAADMVAVRLTRPFPIVVCRQPGLSAATAATAAHRGSCVCTPACACAAQNGSIAPWSFVNGNRPVEAVVSGPLIANDAPTVRGAAVEGVGIAQLPEPIVAGGIKAGRLVRVLEPFAPMAPGVFPYYPGHRQILPKRRAVIDHVKSRSAANQIRSGIDNQRTGRRRRA